MERPERQATVALRKLKAPLPRRKNEQRFSDMDMRWLPVITERTVFMQIVCQKPKGPCQNGCIYANSDLCAHSLGPWPSRKEDLLCTKCCGDRYALSLWGRKWMNHSCVVVKEEFGTGAVFTLVLLLPYLGFPPVVFYRNSSVLPNLISHFDPCALRVHRL